MRLFLPNSAHLQNIEGFLRKYHPQPSSKILRVSGHEKYIHLHPMAIAMAACAGATATNGGWKTTGKIHNVRSVPYLIRMKLFEHLNIIPPTYIEEHEESGRFVPLTNVKTSEDLSKTVTNLIPLLHANSNVADPIRYVISELGRNVIEHSNSQVGGFVCAQYFKNKERIAVGIADSGIGILNAIRHSHPAENEPKAFRLALTPGISGATSRIGGNETNAGAGLFFIRSIAKVSGNFFVIYSGNTLYKIMRKQQEPDKLYSNPFKENHSLVIDLPKWQGTAIGIDISVDNTAEFSALLDIIRKSYRIDMKAQKKAYYKKVKFV